MESSVLSFCLDVSDLIGDFDFVGKFVFSFLNFFILCFFTVSRVEMEDVVGNC